MSLAKTSICEFGWKAVDFALEGTDGRTYALADVRGAGGTVVMFICNHCPYVKAAIPRIVRDMAALRAKGVGAIAIMPNDSDAHPSDTFERMKEFAAERGLTFPYVIDRTQETARAYDALCTPDFFGFDANDGLQYRGRLDEGRTETPPEDVRRELLEAMIGAVEGRPGPAEQTASMGCSIKWRA
jgi:peroxiredoxin